MHIVRRGVAPRLRRFKSDIHLRAIYFCGETEGGSTGNRGKLRLRIALAQKVAGGPTDNPGMLGLWSMFEEKAAGGSIGFPQKPRL